MIARGRRGCPHASGARLAVLGQQPDRIARAALRFGAIRQVVEHRWIAGQPGLQLLHLRAHTAEEVVRPSSSSSK